MIYEHIIILDLTYTDFVTFRCYPDFGVDCLSHRQLEDEGCLRINENQKCLLPSQTCS